MYMLVSLSETPIEYDCGTNTNFIVYLMDVTLKICQKPSHLDKGPSELNNKFPLSSLKQFRLKYWDAHILPARQFSVSFLNLPLVKSGCAGSSKISCDVRLVRFILNK